MRQSLLTATAVLASALLLSSCASTTDPSAEASDTSQSQTESPAATDAPEPTVVTVEQTCAGFYDGGKNSLAKRVSSTFALTSETVTDESGVELATTRDKIASVQRFAEPELQENLNGIKAPFQAALEGVDVVTTEFQPSLDAFRAQCVDAGYEFTS
ncbi:hypothetical protein [Cellulosimicrobium arenosum]|uniref:Lipoprotein n=1 Tax=Cellulosimicrobium arenosum TaxID=2708133 RepID=A0A927J0H0_9MICO|nr:hypothetical protein [Cellulosimicrobium arenosum]MBD8079603.1 hypothetical protein [Cellulosimicrobium arenosum]